MKARDASTRRAPLWGAPLVKLLGLAVEAPGLGDGALSGWIPIEDRKIPSCMFSYAIDLFQFLDLTLPPKDSKSIGEYHTVSDRIHL